MSETVYRYESGSYCKKCERPHTGVIGSQLVCSLCGEHTNDGIYNWGALLRYRWVATTFNLWRPSTWFSGGYWVFDGVGQKEV